MEISHDLSGAAEWRAHSAIVFYAMSSARGLPRDLTQRTIATAHEIAEDGTLSPGERMRAADLRTAAGLIDAPPGQRPAPQVLPANLIYHDPGERVVWTVPESRRALKFTRGLKVSGLRGKKLHHPALLFCLDRGRSLRLFALPGKDRPTAATGLLVAPYWNTHASGRVDYCQVRRPPNDHLTRLPDWEDSFFLSEFSHVSGDQKFKVKLTLPGFWKRRINGRRFPYTQLRSAGLTVGQLLATPST